MAWLTVIAEQKMVDILLLGFTATFSIIHHNFLLKKSESFGFNQLSLLRMKSLSNRKLTFFFKWGIVRYWRSKANTPMYANDSALYMLAIVKKELNKVRLCCDVSS